MCGAGLNFGDLGALCRKVSLDTLDHIFAFGEDKAVGIQNTSKGD